MRRAIPVFEGFGGGPTHWEDSEMRFKLLAAIALLSIGSACSSGSLTDETLVSARRVGLRSDRVKADLLICSPAERAAVGKHIGPEGGALSSSPRTSMFWSDCLRTGIPRPSHLRPTSGISLGTRWRSEQLIV